MLATLLVFSAVVSNKNLTLAAVFSDVSLDAVVYTDVAIVVVK